MGPPFHTEALNLLKIQHVLDSTAVEALRARENQLGVSFPPSFVEWFGMRDGLELLKCHSNSDEPIPIEKLGERVYVTRTRDTLREESGVIERSRQLIRELEQS